MGGSICDGVYRDGMIWGSHQSGCDWLTGADRDWHSHWCKVILPHEKNTDATGADPEAIRRFVTGVPSGSTLAPVLRCTECGENVLERG